MTLNEAVCAIRKLDKKAMEKTQHRLDNIIKPLDSLGLLERHLVQIAGITGSARFDLAKKAVVVFCADNGVVAQNITQSGQEVTAIVAENLTTNDTCVCAMARVVGADVIPVDIGIAREMNVSGLLNRKIALGTEDFTQRPAMTREQAVAALEVGINTAVDLQSQGYKMLATGEMGIGNTTSAAAMAAAFIGRPAEDVTGRGAGLSTEGLERKTAVVKRGLELHSPNPDDAVDVISKVGGYDIAGMAGLCIGGAVCGMPIILDGVISCVAALAACRISKEVRGFILPSHTSAEPAGGLIIKELDMRPPLEADMRLGEGTGAVATFPLYDMIAEVYARMVNFDDENMQAYEQLT